MALISKVNDSSSSLPPSLPLRPQYHNTSKALIATNDEHVFHLCLCCVVWDVVCLLTESDIPGKTFTKTASTH